MTDSNSRVLGSTAADADGTPEPGPSHSLIEAQHVRPTGRSAEFDGYVENIRRRLNSNIPFLFARLEGRIRRRLGLASLSAAAAALAALTGVGIRLAVALLATALVGDWADIPWGRWAPILLYWGLFDATQPLRMPPLDVPLGREPSA